MDTSGGDGPSGSSPSAIFSPCRTWRYLLARDTGIEPRYDQRTLLASKRGMGKPKQLITTVAFIGLNPSTADETKNDPTVTRCIGYAKRWGFDRMVMLNAFAYRATNPKRLRQAADPIGPENPDYVFEYATAADLVVACWGANALWHPNPGYVSMHANLSAALRVAGVELHALGFTKDGAPKHPLYLRKDLDPVPWLDLR